jgi:hypothetical protein
LKWKWKRGKERGGLSERRRDIRPSSFHQSLSFFILFLSLPGLFFFLTNEIHRRQRDFDPPTFRRCISLTQRLSLVHNLSHFVQSEREIESRSFWRERVIISRKLFLQNPGN